MNTQPHTVKGLCMGLLVITTFSLHAAIISTKPHHQGHNSSQMTEKSIMLPTGISMAYVEKGDPSKTTVLFIHGFTDSWHSFEPLMKLLPESFHFVAVTLRGHGESAKPGAGYTTIDFANDVAAFITQLNLGKCIITGHSMGSLVAQQLAISYPQLLAGLVLIGADACFADNPGFKEFCGEIAAMEKPVDWKYAEAFQKSTVANPVDEELMKIWISESLKVPLTVWKQAIDGVYKADFREKLSEISVPALIIAGALDNFCPPEAPRQIQQGIVGSRLKVFDSYGHAVHWENPEAIAELLMEFLQPWR